MSYEVTATKFRPQSFDELIGQEFVASTLKNSIQNKEIANAYLLSGPRGVGKTSAARIIAKSLNCDNGPTGNPCNKCDNCLSITHGNNNDVIEIDGASNTSINDVRVIQEEIMYPPVNSKYKVYIIDEVHMLSKSAFNALLKTIEEPPERVVFIFATTEVNKVLPTIRSRCQQFNFRLIPSDLIYNSLIKVLKNYNVKYEENAIRWVANQGQGSMRDAYTLIDQVTSFCNKNITLKNIQEKLGLVGEERMARLVNGIIEENREKIFVEYFSMVENGITPEQIITELIEFFRNILLIKSNLSSNRFIGFNPDLYDKKIVESFSFKEIENILEVLFKSYERSKISVDIQTEIEICLLKLINYKELIRPKEIISQITNLKESLLKNTTLPIEVEFNEVIKDTHKAPEEIKKEIDASENQERSYEIKIEADRSEIFKILKNKIGAKNFQLATALNNVSTIEEKDNTMHLLFTQKMHYDIAKCNEEILTNIAIDIIGPSYNKNFKITVDYIKQNVKDLSIEEINKKNIKEIFHGEEL